MKKFLGMVGIVAACGACCAFPLAFPLLGGIAASGLGFALGWEAAALAGGAAIAALVVFLRRRRGEATACGPATREPTTSCGCSSGCAPGKRPAG